MSRLIKLALIQGTLRAITLVAGLLVVASGYLAGVADRMEGEA